MDSKELARMIRLHCLEIDYRNIGQHLGPMYSIADTLAVLYNEILNIKPSTIDDPNRDRFVLSKGHAGLAVYSCLAELDFFDKKELLTYGKKGSMFTSHVSKKVPGVEISTGSLGQGIGVASGFALAGKIDNLDYKSICLVGDGECEEGSVWEIVHLAPQLKLDNFIVIVDNNHFNAGTKELGDKVLPNAFESFGWDTFEIDGHDFYEIKSTLDDVYSNMNGKPKCIIIDTIKGKGVSFMENNILWHFRAPSIEEFKEAWKELNGSNSDLLGEKI
jgi:transketolase